MALTSDQLTDMQGDLDISADETVFTNDELNRFYERALDDYNTAVYLAVRQLAMGTTKFFSYTAGQSKVDRAAVFDHVKEMLIFWQEEARVEGEQVGMVGIQSIPPRWKEFPATDLNRRKKTMNWRRGIVVGDFTDR